MMSSTSLKMWVVFLTGWDRYSQVVCAILKQKDGQLQISHCTFTDNNATYGGAIFMQVSVVFTVTVDQMGGQKNFLSSQVSSIANK